MRAKHYHSLKLPRLRMSWNKINLYNIERAPARYPTSWTFFKQKFKAKAATRAYHGEQIREKQWQLMYKASARAVVPMDPQYLAQFDGSEQAQGRGSGREVRDSQETETSFPYPNMTYAPVERRLDTAIFRSLFASSVRQARQFVIHGHVKVNGKKMIYPGYLLNPGDMFQVDIDRVLTATGAPKDAIERRTTRQLRKQAKAAREAVEETTEEGKAQVEGENAGTAEVATEDEMRSAYKLDLRKLLDQARGILSNSREAPSGKKKQQLRAFSRDVTSAIGKANRADVADLEGQLKTLRLKLQATSPSKGPDAKDPKTSKASKVRDDLTQEQVRTLRHALAELRDNPIDPTKAYATPWRPRDYMSAFAFIPRYLEVNQNICSAVYLRHPVVRPGLAEVPTPFSLEQSQLAHTWYLRRR